MKKMNNKGFTIVELVIVIAVIAILAAVMIPTFSGVVNNAKETAALQEITAAYKEAYAKALEGGLTANEQAEAMGFKFQFNDASGVLECEVVTGGYPTDFGYSATFENGAWTLN